MTNIEEKEWIVKGEFRDLFMLINILNNNRNYFQHKKLQQQIEAVACHQCFSHQSSKEVAPDALNEIICLYAFEFSKSDTEFTSFFRKFFDYFNHDLDLVSGSLSLSALSHVAIVYTSYGMTQPTESHIWEKIRAGAIRQLQNDRNLEMSFESIITILGALQVVDTPVDDS